MFRDRLGALCLNRAWTLGVSAESLQVTLTLIPLLSGLLGGKETTIYWCQGPQVDESDVIQIQLQHLQHAY